jgi:pSer/pThr/pTyr-binding forkhead associated (FHA) protein
VRDTPRRFARDLIVAVLDNMRRYQEPLMYSVIVPSRYVIYLHPAEYARLEGILPLLREQTIRGLTDEVERLNRRPKALRYADQLLRRTHLPVESATGDWQVEFLADPDGDVAEGAFVIDSELRAPEGPELGAGDRTRRITTVHFGQGVTTRKQTATRQAASAVRVLARMTHDDESGHHAYDIVKDSTTIGRGGVSYPVDIKIVSSADVSREHARIRHDGETGRFFLIDLSSLGTTLNGRHIPRGYDEVDGTKRENGVETPLPDQARIGLADTVYLDFCVVPSAEAHASARRSTTEASALGVTK